MKWTRARTALLLIGIGLLVAFLLWPRLAREEKTERPLPTAKVAAANLKITLRLTGVVQAVQTHPIVSQTDRTNVVWAATDGKLVKEGEPILRLNSAELETRVSQLKTQVADEEEKVRSARAEGGKKVQNASSALTKAEGALALAQAENAAEMETTAAEAAFKEKELELAKAELDKYRRLAQERLVPSTDVEAAEDERRSREFELELAQRAQKQAQVDVAMEERLRKMDVETAKVNLEQAEVALEESVVAAERSLAAKQVLLAEAEEQLAETEIAAPAAGLLLLDRDWSGETLQVGDEVYEGRTVASIIDTSEMRLRCDIGEAEVERVHLGQEATVMVLALPELGLRGVVKAIDNLAREKRWWEGGVPGQKMFAALIQLRDRDERLRPGMSASVRLVLDKVEKGLAVPVEALFEVKGKPVVYRAEQGRYRLVPVKVGKRNETLVAVEGPLGPGDRVACERPPSKLVVDGEGSQ